MADFRKMSFVLAVLALVAVLAVPAQAQTVSCSASQGSNLPIIRDGGLTELVGDVILTCTPSNPGAAGNVNVNFQIFLSTVVSNRLASASSMLTQAALIKNPDTAFPVVYQGTLQPTLPVDNPAQRNSLLFTNVLLPLGTTTSIRISNVRVVAPPASGSGTLPTAVQEQISTSPAGTVPITNFQQIVAYVLPPVLFSATKCDGTTAFTGTSFQQCVAQPNPSNLAHFQVHFKEGFTTSFKPVGTTAAPGSALVNNTESGFQYVGTTGIGGTETAVTVSDQADTGTRFILRFTNVPTGVKILVSDAEVGYVAAAPVAHAVLVPTADSTGTTGAVVTTPNATAGVTCGGTVTMVDVTKAGYAVWEVTNSTLNQDDLAFAVQIAYTPDTTLGKPGLTGANPIGVTGALAPISTVAQAAPKSATAQEPRFIDKPFPGGLGLNIVPCVTNLLFPFVTNLGGFDTGIALVNTSLDQVGSTGAPFTTPTQHGTCTLYFFNGGTNPPPPQTTPDVPAGSMSVAIMGQGGVSGVSNPIADNTFQGYVIARCNFQFAHGWALVSDRNRPGLGSSSYLALIIPDLGLANTQRSAVPFSNYLGSNTGEQLVQ